MIYLILIGEICLGFLVSFFLTYFVTRKSIQYGVVAHPREDRFHSSTTALMGGIAIQTAFVVMILIFNKINFFIIFPLFVFSVVSVCYAFKKNIKLFFVFSILGMSIYLITYLLLVYFSIIPPNKIFWLLFGGQIIYFVGVYDDTMTEIAPLTKFALQFFAALVIAFGVDTITFLPFPLNYIITVLWVVAITNAFNLIDNMNGLSAGVACIASLFFALISLYNGDSTFLSQICFILLGVCLGFLPHNFPKARIFMGDCGSMFLGYVLASVAVAGSWKTSDFSVSIIIPLLVLAYPIFDVLLVMINRIIAGRPIYLGGKDHSSHRLVRLGLKAADAVFFLYFIVFFTGFAAFFLIMIDFKQSLKMLFFIASLLIIFGLRLSRIEVNYE